MSRTDSIYQLELPWRDENALAAELQSHLNSDVEVIITNNATRIVSAKYINKNKVRLRIHYMFLSAPSCVIEALGNWIRHPRQRHYGRQIDQYIRNNRHFIKKNRKNQKNLRTQGNYYDLKKLSDEINQEYFSNAINARITWGKHRFTKRPKTSIRYGSYSIQENLIRINPVLDCPQVPLYFIQFIIFHEMLHAYFFINNLASEYNTLHHREFRRLEKTFKYYQQAIEWEKDEKNLELLLWKNSFKKHAN